jgi:hypothetical protein
MAKVTLNEVRQAASLAHRRAMSDREVEVAARAETDRITMESGQASAALLFASRMDGLIDGFPSVLDLACKNGHLKGAFFRRHDGKWGIDYPSSYSAHNLVVSQAVVIEAAARAMSIEDSHAAIATVREIVDWDLKTLKDDIVSAAARLHWHSVVGLMGVGHRVGHVFGFRNEDKVAVALAKAAVVLDINLGETVALGKTDVCTRLTNGIDFVFLKAMIEVGGAKPSVASLFSAVYANNIKGVELIVAAGVPVSSLGNRGVSVLHVAATNAVNEHHSDAGIAMFHRLAELGAPLDVVDGDGQVATDIVMDGIRRVEVGDLDGERVEIKRLEWLLEAFNVPIY